MALSFLLALLGMPGGRAAQPAEQAGPEPAAAG
jgi:hypothetical protein